MVANLPSRTSPGLPQRNLGCCSVVELTRLIGGLPVGRSLTILFSHSFLVCASACWGPSSGLVHFFHFDTFATLLPPFYTAQHFRMPRRDGAESSIRCDGTLANGNVKLTTQRAHVTPRRRHRAKQSFLHHLVAAFDLGGREISFSGQRSLGVNDWLRVVLAF